MHILAAILSAILSSITWITNGEAIRILSPLIVAAFSSLFAAVITIILIPLLLKKEKRGFPSLTKLRSLWIPFLFVSLIRNVIGFLLFDYSLLYTSSAKVMFLTKMEPYIVLGLHAALYGERIERGDSLLLLLHIAGAILLSAGSNLSFTFEQWGDVLVLLGLLAGASAYKPGKVLSEAFGSVQTTVLTSLFSAVVLIPFALMIDGHRVFSPSVDIFRGFLFMIVSVLMFYVAGTILWFYSLSAIPAWLNSALRCLGPVVAAPIAWLFFDKSLEGIQIVGATIVIWTSIVMVLRPKRFV
jgi:drug/metabolite transporter (DMT)-like permease